MGKICTVIDDYLFIEAREAYEYRFGRWKKGSLKTLIEKGLDLFLKEYEVPHKKPR